MYDLIHRTKTLTLTLLLLCTASPALAEPINAILGDESWEVRFGQAPVEGEDDEVERIQTHLRYVVAKLRGASVEGLDATQRTRRAWLLRELETYTEAGVFPQREAKDGWGVRRPQFIDASGVHCAVGEMIRVSGHAALARRIDRDHEFEYVRQMDVPALGAWAKAWGFDARELGMIQPGYSAPPNFEGAKHKIKSRVDSVVRECGQITEPDEEIKLRVKGGADGVVSVTLEQPETPFSTCAIQKFQVRFGGAWNGSPEVFDKTLAFKMPARETLLTQQLQRIYFHSSHARCLLGPLPTPLMDSVTVRAFTSAIHTGVEVKTQPSHPEIEACIQGYVEKALRLKKGKWNVDVTQTREVQRLVRPEYVKEQLMNASRNRATACYALGAPKGELRVAVNIIRETQSITFKLSQGTDAFQACLRQGLKDHFKGSLTKFILNKEGPPTRYVRYDADASASTSFVVETPEAQKARHQRLRRHDRMY